MRTSGRNDGFHVLREDSHILTIEEENIAELSSDLSFWFHTYFGYSGPVHTNTTSRHRSQHCDLVTQARGTTFGVYHRPLSPAHASNSGGHTTITLAKARYTRSEMLVDVELPRKLRTYSKLIQRVDGAGTSTYA